MNIYDIRRRFHQIAEISGKELRTNQTIVDILNQLNPDLVINNLNNSYSLAAIFEGNRPGKTICFRADIDALPIEDKISTDYVSTNPNASHKCGHDGHLSILLGLADRLKEKNYPGKVVLLFQAEEETGTGAEKVIKDKRFLNLNIDSFYGLHNLPGFEEKSIVIKDGTFASASQGIIIRLSGTTSHAAEPENGNSPVLAMTAIINNLIALPQRNTNFNDSNLVTIIHANLGEKAFGTSPSEATVMATIRSDSQENMDKMCADAENICNGLAKVYNLKCEINYKEVFPATTNHDYNNDIIRKAAKELNLDIIERSQPFPWSEDFGHYLNYKSGAFFGLGAGIDSPKLHNPDYDFNDEIIKSGIEMFWKILELENKPS